MLNKPAIDAIISDSYAPMGEIPARFIRYATDTPALQHPINYLTGADLPDLLKHYSDKMQSWPFFISSEYFDQVQYSATQIPLLISQIPQLIFDNQVPAICDYFELEPLLINMLLSHKWQGPAIISRGDFINTAEGLKCLEQNMGSNLGGWETELICDDYLQTPGVKQFFDQNKVTYQAKNVLQAWFEYCVELTLEHTKLVDSGCHNLFICATSNFYSGGMDSYFRSIYQTVLAKHNLSGSLFLDTFDALQMTPKGVFCQEQRIHCISNPLSQAMPSLLLRSYMASKVYLSDDPINTLLSDKRTLAVLSSHVDDTERLSPEQRQLILDYIPWTRDFRDEQVSYQGQTTAIGELALAQQAQFVLKRANGMGGKDLVIGCKASVEQWREAVALACEEKAWVIQQYYPSLTYLGQQGDSGYGTFDAIWGTFCFGDKLAKVWMRLQSTDNPSGVINSHQGAEETMVYIMDPA